MCTTPLQLIICFLWGNDIPEYVGHVSDRVGCFWSIFLPLFKPLAWKPWVSKSLHEWLLMQGFRPEFGKFAPKHLILYASNLWLQLQEIRCLDLDAYWALQSSKQHLPWPSKQKPFKLQEGRATRTSALPSSAAVPSSSSKLMFSMASALLTLRWYSNDSNPYKPGVLSRGSKLYKFILTYHNF